MDEKDRHIVTFGEDTVEVVSEDSGRADFSFDRDLPGADEVRRVIEASAADVTAEAPVIRLDDPEGGSAAKPEGAAPASAKAADAAGKVTAAPKAVVSVEGVTPDSASGADAAPSEVASNAASAAPAADAAADIGETVSRYSEPAAETASETAQAGSTRSRHDIPDYSRPAHASAPPKPKKEKKYVTKGALVVCLVVTMLVSAALGAFVSTALPRLLPGVLPGTSDSREARDDSALSQLDLSDATGSDMTVAEIVGMNADAVVEIVVEGTTQGMWGQLQLTQGAGSGVIIREDGYIATNYHVIDGANKIQVTLHNGESYPARLVGSDAENDIAVVKIDEKGLTTAKVGDSSTVKVGDLAVAIGNPLGQLGGTATTGIISALDRTLNVEGTTLTLLQTDAAINGGNSGGGLFNSKGELIGVVESKASAVGVEGLAFAIPINSVSQIINDIIENGGSSSENASNETPAVGIVISEVSEDNAQYYGLESAGVYIAQVTGANALKAGFQEGDRIVSFNGQEISTSNEFITLVRKCKVGDTVSVVVSRNGQQMEIKTELEALNTQQE